MDLNTTIVIFILDWVWRKWGGEEEEINNDSCVVCCSNDVYVKNIKLFYVY